MTLTPIRNVVEFSIGGGWGTDTEIESSQLTRVLRGADFPDAAVQRVENAPLRWEKSNKIATRKLGEGDIVLEVSGGTKNRSTGRSIFVTEKMVKNAAYPLIPASFCRKLRVNRDVADPRFVFYWLQLMFQSGRGWSYQNQSTGIANFQFEQFLDDELLWLPDLTVQKATSSFLGSLDDQIAANLTAVQKTNALAIALAGRRSQNTSQTPLRELTSQISRGVAPKYDDLGKYVVLNQKCIRDSQVDIARARSMKSLPKSPGKVLRQNDVLVNSTGQGTLGRIARWTSSDPNTSVDTHVSIVRFDPEVADPAFAGTVLSTMGRLVEDLAEGSTGQTELKRDLLGSLKLSLPPLDVQREVGQRIKLLDELCRTRIEENLILAKTRDELLPLLMSGKITVKEAEQEAATAGADIAGEESEA